MAKISRTISISSPPDRFDSLSEIIDYLDELTQDLQDCLDAIYEEFNGKIELINQRVAEVTISDTGTADTDFTITHNLGVVPRYYIWNIDRNGVVYKGATTWTTTNIYLRCSVANAEVKIIVIP